MKCPGFAQTKNDPSHHRYDNLPEPVHYYQNHFFATIYDSDGANGTTEILERRNSFERQNSSSGPENFDHRRHFDHGPPMLERLDSLGETETFLMMNKVCLQKPKSRN